MNEVDVSLKVKLKMAIIAPLPVHHPTNTMWLFVLDWASLGVWPHNLILLAQTSLQPSATLALLFRSAQNTTSPRWDLNVPPIIQNVKQGVAPSPKINHTNLPKGIPVVGKCILTVLKFNSLAARIAWRSLWLKLSNNLPLNTVEHGQAPALCFELQVKLRTRMHR